MRLCIALLLATTVGLAFAIPDQYESDVRPSVDAYQIPGDLSGVRHMGKITGLNDAQLAALAKKGFVVVPDEAEQMFLMYEEYGEDSELGPVPNFITVDSVLQAYHVLFDFALRTIEQEKLLTLCTELTQFCTGQSLSSLAGTDGVMRDAAMRNLVFFMVARNLLTGKEPTVGNQPFPPATGMAEQELALIKSASGRSMSPLFERTVHYDQFIPRGHYTRSPELKKYFMAMMWYGLTALELDQPRDNPDLIRRHCAQALLITRMLRSNDWARSLWERIYEPTAYLVGTADDLTWRDYEPIAVDVFGPKLDKLGDLALLDEFIRRARAALPAPRIAPAFQQADEQGNLEMVLNPPPQGRQFRFMGQRFIPDSYALQQLVYPLVGGDDDGNQRYFPMGLDVMAVLGSARAEDLLLGQLRQGRFEGYTDQLTKVYNEFAALPEADWWQNTYYGWLHALKPLLAPTGEGYPTFMRSVAWLDKELVTSLGSWAQLRHGTILYGKPSGAEMGGDEPRAVQGYVEPYPRTFGRLCYLARLLRDGLKEHGLLTERIESNCDEFGGMLMFLKKCAEKHLQNMPLSEDEYWRIQYFGGELERLTVQVASDNPYMRWFEITSEADRNIATIADIHTSFDQCLEVGPGWAYRIYVITPHPAGGLQVAKGGVMSYHEFKWPVSDRLTDEKWLKMLREGTAPPMPEWTGSFIVR
ncbi:MAG: DUF3160 domain-containing protein [Armatimonadetes bacterium]|nr:DUF3160 domain-containing protein [Armatimonadota bacterium]